MAHFPFASEFKFVNEAEGTFTGYGAIFNNTDFGGDIVVKGAFRETLRDHKARKRAVPMFLHHDHTKPAGVWTSIVEDEKGLRVEGRLALGVQDADEAHRLMKMGALTGLSIGYKAEKAERDKSGARRLLQVKLWEISLVALPMNDDARLASVKWGDVQTNKDFERLLRDVGCPIKRAKRLARGFVQTADGLRDVGTDDAAEVVRMLRDHLKEISQPTDLQHENRRRTAA